MALTSVSLWTSCTVDDPGASLESASGGQAGTNATSVGGNVGIGATSSSGGNFAVGGTFGSGGVLNMAGTLGTAGNDACEADVSVAEGVGLDMYIVFDRSGSMSLIRGSNSYQDTIAVPADGVLGDCPVDLVNAPAQDSRWCLATNALARFFTTNPGSDVRVALQFMTPAVPENEICGADAGNPHAAAAVPFTPLPVQPTDPLIAALDAEVPHTEDINGVSQESSGTRIEGALNGISMFTAANADPERRTIGVLITDGVPYNCDENVGNLAQIAIDHFQTNNIATFFIGMTGADADQLETMAVDSGAPDHADFCDPSHTSCHYWTVGDGDAAAFTAVLQAIQNAVVIPCEYSIPIPSAAGQTINANLINVTYNDGSGNPPATVFKVDSAAACDPVTGGWYFDDPAAPTAVRLCQTNCDLVTVAPPGAAVEILYGCDTIVP